MPNSRLWSLYCTKLELYATLLLPDFQFYRRVEVDVHPADEKSSLKGAWTGSGDPFQNFTPHVISPQRLTLETSNFVHGSAMWSLLSLVLVLWWVSVSWVGVVRVTWAISTIVDLENFAAESRRYTGDIHVLKSISIVTYTSVPSGGLHPSARVTRIVSVTSRLRHARTLELLKCRTVKFRHSFIPYCLDLYV